MADNSQGLITPQVLRDFVVSTAHVNHQHSGADITSGVIAPARLGTGTADGTTYLRGDGTWATVAGGGGGVTSVNGETGAVTLDAADVGAAPATHTHVIGDTTGLQAALDAKAGTTHTHVIGDTTGLQAALDERVYRPGMVGLSAQCRRSVGRRQLGAFGCEVPTRSGV